MKQFTILIVALLTGCFFAYGQSKAKPAIPVLKESKKVDQLMDLVLNSRDSKSGPVNTCYMIDILATGEKHFSLQIEKNTNTITDTLVNGISIGKDLFGCFIYKKQIVFVWADKSLTNLFVKTPGIRTFDFIHKLIDVQPPRGEYFLDIWHYQYANGEISEEGPPPAQ
jgi:hypothetical protein